MKNLNIMNIILWLLFGVVIFYVLKYILRFFGGFLGFGNPIKSLTDDDKKEVADQSGQIMANGNFSFRTGSAYLYQKMYDVGGWGWFKNTDTSEVGEFMRKVTPSEYQLLSNVYSMYKETQTHWYDIVGRSDSLSDDLRDLFSSSEESKYLSHLSNVL